MCLLSPREVGPGAEASPRARRGHSRHTASDCVTLGAVYSSPVRLWDAYVRREGAQPRTGQRPRGRTGASGTRGLEPSPHSSRCPRQAEAGPSAAWPSPKFWTLAGVWELAQRN